MTAYNAVFRIDQDRPGPSTSTGTPGVSRRDLWLTHTLHLVPTSPPPEIETTFLWEFLDKPTGSTAQFLDESSGLPDPTSKYVKFDPDVWGTYRVRLTINNGQYFHILLGAVILTSAGLVTKRGWRIPSFKEIDTDDNFPGQVRGYAYDWDVIFNDILENAFEAGGEFIAGGDLAGTPTEQTVVGIRARLVSSTAPTDGQLLTWVAIDAAWEPQDPPSSFTAGGDLSGSTTSQTVIGLQGFPVDDGTPTTGQILQYGESAWGAVDFPELFFAPQKKTYDLSAGEMVATTLLANARIIGGDYFDPADWLGDETGRTRKVYFRVILSSSVGTTTAYVSIYDKDGITNAGVPIVIASSILSTTNTTPTRFSVDLSAALGSVTLKGILEAQLYVSVEGESSAAVCQQAKLEVEWVTPI
jgi:hypothetical protein